ncbi:MAG TPA: nuclease-related domain-containing protein [Arthrobacter sp.]
MNGIYGMAATGLNNDSSFAVNEAVAKIGAQGEERTAMTLNGFGLKAAVLHDLRVPIPGFKSNIDHIIVSGKRVLVLDTKVWKPGFYWTLAGKNRRGTERIKHTEKDVAYLQAALITYLRGTGATITLPHLVIWPSSTHAKISFWLLRVPGASRLLHGTALLGFTKRFITRAPADPVITAKLAALCMKKTQPATAQAAVPRQGPGSAYDDSFDSAPSRKFTPAGPSPFN